MKQSFIYNDREKHNELKKKAKKKNKLYQYHFFNSELLI
jgi:hypothetical protein